LYRLELTTLASSSSSSSSSSSFFLKKKQVPHRGGYSRDDISRHRKLIRAD